MKERLSEKLQKEGNDLCARGDHQGALQKYAAALAASTDKVRCGALRANRSLCCLKLGTPELALSEAEQCKELRPDWPKAHFRFAMALEALGRGGEARVALHVARRLAPKDKEVAAAVKAIRLRLFPGETLRVGEAIDVLEDFDCDSTKVLAAARELHAVVSDTATDNELTAACIQAFVNGGGTNTVFRRQNAMGTNWMEEAKNGTMTLLSQIAAAVPKLEQDLVRLNQEAEHREKGKAECADKPTRPGTAPRPPAPPLMTGRKKRGGGAKSLFNACNFADSPNTQISVDSPPLPDAQTRMTKAARAPPDVPQIPEGVVAKVPVVQDSKTKFSTPKAQAPMEARCWPRKSISGVFELMPKDRALRAVAAAAAVSTCWAGAVRAISETDPLWRRWGESRCPSVAALPPTACSRTFLRLVGRPVMKPRPADLSLASWYFVVDFKREGKSLWQTVLDVSHSHPSLRVDDRPGRPADQWCGAGALYMHADVIETGGMRRFAIAGSIAALGDATKEEHRDNEEVAEAVRQLSIEVTAVHSSGRAAPLVASLLYGSRCVAQTVTAAGQALQTGEKHFLTAAVGLGGQQAVPRQGKFFPQGSVEVFVGLAFSGPDGSCILPSDAGSVAPALTAFLEAEAAGNG